MACVVDKDEGRLLSAAPAIGDSFSKIIEQIHEGLEVGVFNNENVHSLGAQANYSLPHVDSVIVNCREISEARTARSLAELTVVFILYDDPLEVDWSDFRLNILLLHLKCEANCFLL